MRKYLLSPGTELYYLPFEHFKTVSVRIYIHQPLLAETATANALLPEVLLRGCKKYPTTRDLNLYLEELYGATLDAFVSKRGEDQLLCFSIDCIADAYVPEQDSLVKKAAEVLHELLFCPLVTQEGFSEEYIQQEKKNLKDALLARINDKRSYATDRCIEEMCKEDPYAVYEGGDMDKVDGITNTDLMQAYSRMLSGPVTIFVTGKTDPKLICDLFSDFPTQEKAYPVGSLFVPEAQARTVTERLDVTQGKLTLGFATGVCAGDSDFFALLVGNSVFGAGAHSKLFKNVREKLSLAYYAYSRIERFKGLMVVGAGIEFSNFHAAQEEIMQQLRAVQNGDITLEELDSAKKAIVSALIASKDSPEQRISHMLGNILSDTHTDLEEEISKINAVTTEEIVAVFQKIVPQLTYFLTGTEA